MAHCRSGEPPARRRTGDTDVWCHLYPPNPAP